MKKTAAVLLASLLLAQNLAISRAATCAAGIPGWTCNNTYKKCYQRLTTAVSFASAQVNCAPAATGQAGSKLNEPSFLNGESSYIQTFVPLVPTVPTQNNQVIWIGVIKQPNCGNNWAYASNTAVTFDQSLISPWGQNQPDGSGNYLNLAKYQSWSSIGFDDGSPGANKYPLCEVACT